jgi:hypothetical protein
MVIQAYGSFLEASAVLNTVLERAAISQCGSYLIDVYRDYIIINETILKHTSICTLREGTHTTNIESIPYAQTSSTRLQNMCLLPASLPPALCLPSRFKSASTDILI